jgi:beta-fructofuranosidase
VDWGAYYAAKTMLDADGNRILWGWITETRPDADLIAAGWAGAMSLPRVLSLNAKNELQMNVAPAAQRLRSVNAGIASNPTPGARRRIFDTLRIHHLAAELNMELTATADPFSIHLNSDDGENFATISCTTKSGSRELRVNSVTAPLSAAPGSSLHLHLFLDGSVLEVFVNRTTALTARIYQIPSGPLRLKIGGSAALAKFNAWQLAPISKDRLTASLCP